MKYAFGKADWIGARDEQQDVGSVVFAKSGGLCRHGEILGVLADGVGGASNGKQAATETVKRFISSYSRRAKGESIPFALERSLKEANDGVVALRQKGIGETSGYATLVAAVIQERALYWISAGDSRAYLLRKGRLHRLTADHNVATMLNEAVADGTLPLKEAEKRTDGERLLSYLGLSQMPKSDGNIQALSIVMDDRILLCTDGVYGTLNEDVIASIARENSNLDVTCAGIIGRIKQQPLEEQDNATVIMLAPAAPLSRAQVLLRLVLAVLVVIDIGLLGALMIFRRAR